MNIAVYCSAREALPEEVRADASALGQWIGANGHTLVYGGLAMGLMDIVATATAKAGGKIIGVVPQTRISRRHPHNTVDIMVATLHERKQTMEENAHAFVALDGGFGTLDEIMAALASTSFFDEHKPIHLLDRQGLYNPISQMMEEMERRGLVSHTVVQRLRFHPTIGHLISELRQDANAMSTPD